MKLARHVLRNHISPKLAAGTLMAAGIVTGSLIHSGELVWIPSAAWRQFADNRYTDPPSPQSAFDAALDGAELMVPRREGGYISCVPLIARHTLGVFMRGTEPPEPPPIEPV